MGGYGWLQPSVLMADQFVPTGGSKEPVGGFFEKWWTDLVIAGAIVAGGVWWLGIGITKNQPLIPIIVGLLFGGVTWYLRGRGLSFAMPVFVLAVGMLLAGVWMVVRRFTNLNS